MLVLEKIRFILRAQWLFRKPRKAPVVIFDRESLSLLKLFFHEKEYVVLDVRGESINFFILFCVFLTKLVKKNNSLEHLYKEVFIEKVQPKIVITLIDNNVSFYRLGCRKNAYTKIFIQNGLRGEVDDVFMTLRQSKPAHHDFVDYMFVFNASVGNEYLKYIAGEVKPIGSLKNNLVTKNGLIAKNTILFLSQFDYIHGYDENSTVSFNGLGKPISWEDFYASESLFLPWLARFAKKQGLHIQVCLRSLDDSKEKEYFQKLLENNAIEFLPRQGLFSSYEYMDNAQYVVTIDSTMGYEALARGCRVGLFTLRGSFLQSSACNFGWPGSFADTGSFWTNKADEVVFEKVMHYIMQVSDEEWLEVSQQYAKKVMAYDPGNTEFLSLMKQLNIPVKSKVEFAEL